MWEEEGGANRLTSERELQSWEIKIAFGTALWSESDLWLGIQMKQGCVKGRASCWGMAWQENA